MRRDSTTLVVGVGSAHGDDQAGWNLIDELNARADLMVNTRKLSVPHGLLDCLEGTKTLHIVDACHSDSIVQRFNLTEPSETNPTQFAVHCFSDPDIRIETIAEIPVTRSVGSHQLDLPQVIELGMTLDRLPPQVILWALAGVNFHPGDSLSKPCQAAVKMCLNLLRKELVGKSIN